MWQEVLVGAVSGIGASIAGAAILNVLLNKSLDHFLEISRAQRGLVGQSDLEYRKQQMAEFYGPLYAYIQVSTDLYTLWLDRKLDEINEPIKAKFRADNEAIMKIITTKAHLIDGDEMPEAISRLMTSITIWNLYIGQMGKVPEQVAALEKVKFPMEFVEYITTKTRELKRKIDVLHRKYEVV